MAKAVDMKMRKKTIYRSPRGSEVEWDERRFLTKLTGSTDEILKDITRGIYRTARKVVPVGTIERNPVRREAYGQRWYTRRRGRLKGSTKMFRSRYRNGGYIVTTGGHLAYYWFFVEYGTKFKGERKYMRRAMARGEFIARTKGLSFGRRKR